MALRVLHVVGGLDCGGIETWLVNMLKQVDPKEIEMDFLVHKDQPFAYTEEILALGSRIFPCRAHRKLWNYARNFLRILREHGPYDVVHSHVHHFSGIVLAIAHMAGVPVRIAHSHSDTSNMDICSTWLRKLYIRISGFLIHKHATINLSASRDAAESLFGKNCYKDLRLHILYCGIDLNPFTETVDHETVRAELGIPQNAFVIGHVGRFAEAKNHLFLLNIAAEVIKRLPTARLLLIGDGPMQSEIKKKVEQHGLTQNTIFAGVRSDVARVLRGAMDVFVFPSLYEGLGLAAVEAQAAGLPCILSTEIPAEADVVKPLVRRVNLMQPAAAWADVIFKIFNDKPKISQKESMAAVDLSPFNINTSVQNITHLYQSHCEISRSQNKCELRHHMHSKKLFGRNRLSVNRYAREDGEGQYSQQK